MDPPQKLSGSLLRQDALCGDLPEPTDMDPNAVDIPESLQVFPDDSSERILPGLIASAEPDPPGKTDPPSSNRLQPVRPPPPPPPPKSRLLSACLPDTQSLRAPPLPPRSQMPLGNKQFSLDLPEAAHRLTRSWTQVEHHVSVSWTHKKLHLSSAIHN